MWRALVLPDTHRGFRGWKKRVRWINGSLLRETKDAPPTLIRLVERWNGRRK